MLGNPLTSCDGDQTGELCTLRREHGNRFSEGKTEGHHHKDHFWPSLPSREAVCTPLGASGAWVLRLRLLILVPRKRTSIDCCEDTLKIQLGDPEKCLGLPERQGIIAAKTLQLRMLAYCKTPASWVSNHGTSPGCELRFQRYISQAWHKCQRQTAHNGSLLSQRDHLVLAWVMRRRLLWSQPQAELPPSCKSHGLLPIFSWGPVQRGSAQRPWGSAQLSSDRDNFPQVQTTAALLT